MSTISIVIPVFNEEKRLQKAFAALDALRLPRGLKLSEVIFVNDGSADNSFTLLKKYRQSCELPVSILSYGKNQGKGFAVKTGMLASNADFTLLCDADMSTPFSELSKFMPMLKNGIDVVIGTRKNGKSTVVVHQPMLRELLGRGFTLFTQKTLHLSVTDFTCGFKLFSKSAVRTIFPKTIIKGWGYDAETLFLAKTHSISLAECPVVWSDDKGSHVRLMSAVPRTITELARILITHSFLPYMKTVSMFSLARVNKLLAVSK